MRTRLAGALLCIVLLCSCATPPQTRTLGENPPHTLPTATELDNTPFYSQQRYQCGPAALATVLASYSVDVSLNDLAEAVYIPELHGSLAEEIMATARSHAMLAYPLKASLQDLVEEIAAGHPVLVMQNLGTKALPNRHFAVAIGYDLEKQQLILRSGTTRRWKTSFAVFERTWARSQHWALVILPAGQIPATAETDRYLRAVVDLETSGQTSAAAKACQAAVDHWPQQPHVWMARGNQLYSSGDYPEAAGAFSTATVLEPDNPQGWNNLAYALLAASCPAKAQQAVARAVALAPGDAEYQDSLVEIRTGARANNASQCTSGVSW